MKTQIKTITPAWAKSVLDNLAKRQDSGAFLQRNMSQARVKRYASEMKNGFWIFNGDTIRFNTDGDLIDGQTRLAAVVESGVSVQAIIVTGIPKEHRNGIVQNPMDTIDRGRPRSTGSQLQISHGYKNANNFGAAANAIIRLVTAQNQSGTTGQILFVLGIYRHHIEAIFETTANIRFCTGPITAPLALYHAAFPEKAIEFASAFFNMENMKSGTPVHALATWKRNHSSGTGAERDYEIGVVCSCIYHFHHGNKVSKVYYNKEGINWLLAQQKSNVRKIREVMNPTELLKA